MRIDRVIADRPEHAADVQQERRPGERAGDRGPADQRSPIEIEAQKYLRPIGDALHERIGGDQHENGSPEQDRNAVEAEKNRRPDRQLQQQKNHRLAHRNGAARQWPQPGTGDLPVIITVRDIVQGAAGAAHGNGAYRKEQQQDRVGPTPRGERDSPPAWEQQEPRSDRTIEPGQPGIRPDRRGQPALHPVILMDVASIGRRFDCDETLARLAALGPLSGNAGEGGPTPQSWVGEGGFPGVLFHRHRVILTTLRLPLK